MPRLLSICFINVIFCHLSLSSFLTPSLTTNQRRKEDESDIEEEDDRGSVRSCPIMDLTTSMDPHNQAQQSSVNHVCSGKGRPQASSGITKFYSGIDMADHALSANEGTSTGNMHEHHLKSNIPKSAASFRSDFNSWEQQGSQGRSAPTLQSTGHVAQPGVGQEQDSSLQLSAQQHHQQNMMTSSTGVTANDGVNATGRSSGMMSPTGSISSLSTSACDSMSPAQLSLLRKRKRRPQPIPDDCKDDAYWERRKRNNESAKRSREMRRMKEQQTTMRVIYLEQDNLRLKTEVDMLRTELEKLREILYNRNNVNFH